MSTTNYGNLANYSELSDGSVSQQRGPVNYEQRTEVVNVRGMENVVSNTLKLIL